MADYIDRGKVLEAILDLPPKMDEQGYGWLGRMGVWQMIRDFQSADVALVVHGRWKLGKSGNDFIGYPVYNCSVCGYWNEDVYGFLYCPNCGAKMGGEE